MDPTSLTTAGVDCFGCGEGEHPFMRAEGYCKCKKCENILCCECTFSKTMENEEQPYQYCYHCYLPEVSIEPQQIDSDLTTEQIRDALTELGIETNATDDLSFLLDIFDAKKDSPIYSQNVTMPTKQNTFVSVSTWCVIHCRRKIVNRTNIENIKHYCIVSHHVK
jgi:hypothetical protein